MYVHSRLLTLDIILTILLAYPQRLSFRRNPGTESILIINNDKITVQIPAE